LYENKFLGEKKNSLNEIFFCEKYIGIEEINFNIFIDRQMAQMSPIPSVSYFNKKFIKTQTNESRNSN